MIERQFSPTVAAAQEAPKVEAVFQRIREGLLSNDLPDPLKNLGLRYNVVDDVVCADLHGFSVRTRYDHVWLKDGHPIARLGGRLRFVCTTPEGKDGDELFRVLFDHLGNARVRAENGYDSSLSGDPQDVASFVRQPSPQLANAIHHKMAIIE